LKHAFDIYFLFFIKHYIIGNPQRTPIPTRTYSYNIHNISMTFVVIVCVVLSLARFWSARFS